MTIHLIRGLEGTGKTALCRVLSQRGYAAIDTDIYPGLSQWITHAGEPAGKTPDYVDENWIKSHRYIWRPERVQELLAICDGRQAFFCGSATNAEDYYGVFGRRFYLGPRMVRSRVDCRSATRLSGGMVHRN